MWSLTITKSPTLYAGLSEPQALVEIKTSTPRLATTRTGNVSFSNQINLLFLQLLQHAIHRVQKILVITFQFIGEVC